MAQEATHMALYIFALIGVVTTGVLAALGLIVVCGAMDNIRLTPAKD